jgi:hypothetical protein
VLTGELKRSGSNAIVDLLLVAVRELSFVDVPVDVLPLGQRDLLLDLRAVESTMRVVRIKISANRPGKGSGEINTGTCASRWPAS